MVDASGSVGAENYPMQLEFLKQVAAELELSPEGTRAAMVSYTWGDGDVKTEFQFQDNVATFNNYVDNVEYANGFTLTGDAIEHAYVDIIRPYARYEAQVSIVVITDGFSFDDVKTPSDLLRAVAVDMFAIGVKNYNIGQLKDIANQPYDDYLYEVKEFEEIKNITLKFVSDMCTQNFRQYNHSQVPDSAACYHSPCFNDGLCVNNIDFSDYTCICDENWTGPTCETAIPCGPEHVQCSAGRYSTCTNNAAYSDYTCTCETDASGYVLYKGKNCDTASRCNNQDPCQNGASCSDQWDVVEFQNFTVEGLVEEVLVTNYACSCVGYFGGDDCEIPYSPCTGSPVYSYNHNCQNSGVWKV